jgi:hypothetical protein
MTNSMASQRAAILATLALLALLPYWPLLLTQPLISDDYLQIHLGRFYGPMDSWPDLAQDALYRCRATSIVLTHWTEMVFGVEPVAFYATGMLLHVACTWLVWMCARAVGMEDRVAVLGAAIFAWYEGHQEAVMWYASLPELLLFLFCGLFVLCWQRWIGTNGLVWYAAASVCFVMALLSKEPGVVLVPVGAALLYRSPMTPLKRYAYVVPYCLLAAIYAWGVFSASRDHLHLNDGTFSIRAPFPVTWLRSTFRMLWFWGLLASIWLAFRRGVKPLLASPAAFWMAIALVPYCFLTYMPHVPSRHVYLASAGLCLITGASVAELPRRRWVAAVLLAMLVHNTGYIWIRKRAQFLERAEPTEELLRAAQRISRRPLRVCSFPYGPEVAERAMQIMRNEPPSSLQWNTTPCDVGR